MAYTLQLLRALVEAHPDRASRLTIHIEALETAIVGEPDRCLERVRALFEAMFHSIAPHLGLAPISKEDFPAQVARIIKALDFALDGHPDAEKIGEAIRKLLGSINGTIGALAELSNIPGMRHGGSLDWSTLQRQHAQMLGGLCDALVAFLFDIAWSREAVTEEKEARYSADPDYNNRIDEALGPVEVAGGLYASSLALFHVDPMRYKTLRVELYEEELDEADGELPA